MTAAAPPQLSVVIPVYDEEAIVRGACVDLMTQLDQRGWDYEIVVSENGSTDGTVAELAALAAERPRLRFLHSDRPDYGNALRRGILAARGAWVVADEIDLCDVVFYDRALPILGAGGVDMVVGSKRAPGSRDRRPLYRRLATAAYNTLLRIATGFRGTDTHGVKAFVRASIAPIAERCVLDGDVFASELVLRAWRETGRVVEIPIALAERRPPSVALFRRIPSVARSIVKLMRVLHEDARAAGPVGSPRHAAVRKTGGST
jgi:glycosyltransferase involved in cell wall biosynthesis